jgi:transposase-like protein|tara:strand:- start:67 stop:264 length:198 start_codon:yes stop_codon:yes gene_type:complete
MQVNGIMSNELLQNLIKKIELTYGSIWKASQTLNVDYSTLLRWRKNIQKPNTGTLERIAEEMNRK